MPCSSSTKGSSSKIPPTWSSCGSTMAKVHCNTGCRRRREQGRRKRRQERLEPKWLTDYSLRVRTPHDLSVRVLWLEWQWPLPVAYALFLLASCFLKRVAVAAPFCHSHRVPWKGLGHWARDPENTRSSQTKERHAQRTVVTVKRELLNTAPQRATRDCTTRETITEHCYFFFCLYFNLL